MNAPRALAAVAILGAGFFALYELVERPESAAFAPVIAHGGAATNAVALTFDDGPTRGVTDALLGVLERERVPATFFVVGRAARRAPDLLARMVRDGDEIENHSETHAHLNAMLPARIDAELARTDAAIVAAGAPAPRYLRPPFGARNAVVIDAARRHGLQVVLWNAADDRDPAALAARVRPGAIVLLHDGDRGRGDAGELAYQAAEAPALIRALRARGVRMVTLASLLRGEGGR
ncbi:chitooligosaccharide deacetylase NodB [Vulcanimicrobium alpinum]|uniref:Chitooligosaccharide deacetylase NodB n=1 Tax=Vulcanimicrobium alpinum TaxID=3016050 RepID=A0AAN2CAF9_UNVUL|nr:polysaccharide deacetylase family protein [Vulcanimicrobium alpinum]BDE06883.1 chitooligosaccharide deacetylase NodB [Vulcanimicrobium alpinum]